MLDQDLEIHCIGGFAVTMQYGLSRATSDVDVLDAVPHNGLQLLQRIAGEGTDLHKRFGVYLQPATIASCPEDYASRLVRMWPDFELGRLRVFVLEPHDLALTKIDRNSDVDRQDVTSLAKANLIDIETLRKRYEEEFRPSFVGRTTKTDLTLELWIEMIREALETR